MKPIPFAFAITCVTAIPQLARAQFAEPDVDVVYALHAEAAGDAFGFVAETIGDLDGDHAPDFVVGAPFNTAGGSFAGRAYVYSGRTGHLLHVVTGSPGDLLGYSVGSPGDLDRDGVPDYLVGGSGGRVVALSGRDHHTLFDVRVTGEQFGFTVAGAGDINHDGHPDVIVGAWTANTATGKTYILSGRDGSILRTADGPNVGAGLGQGVAGIGDVNHDGVPDQVAAAPGAGVGNLGAAFIYSGRDGSILRTLLPDPTAQVFGKFFTKNAGDVDRDGIDDILISDFSDTELGPFGGKAYVFSGKTGERLWVFLGDAAGDGFGEGRGVGDVDHDHHADLLIAGYNSSAGATSGGKVSLFSGKDGHVIRTFTGNVEGVQLGFDALGIGDIDRDHETDYLITGNDVAYVVSGARKHCH
jgi:hypothetical protein